MAKLDRQLAFYLALLAFGLALTAVAFLGEFVYGWWNDLGEWLAWFGIAFSIVAAVLTASRFQVRELGAGISRVETNTQRIEANTQRIEANTEGLPRIEANTHETNALLREIRDRLPEPRR